MVREVEPQAPGRDERARLPRVVAQHVAERPVHDVRRGVRAGGGISAFGVHLSVDLLALADLAGPHDAGVHDQASRPELRVQHVDRSTGSAEDPPIADLPTGLGVEGRPVQDDPYLLALARDRRSSVRPEEREQPPIGREGLVADELGLARFARDGRELLLGGHFLRRALGALALFGHQGLEPIVVDLQTGVGRELARELLGEAEGVVQLEHDVTGEPLLARRLLDLRLEQGHPLPERAGEPALLRARDLLDVGAVLDELRIRAPEDLDGALDEGRHHFALDAQAAGVRDHAPEHAAKDVAATLVRRLDAVGDQEGRRSAVLGDHLERDVVTFVASVRPTRERLRDVEQRSHQVGLEHVRDVLQHARDALEPGPGVDVLGRQLRDDPPARVDLVLDEDVIPDLHVAILVHLGSTLGAVPRPAVDEDLRARSAEPGRSPIVVVLAAPDDPLGRDPDVAPDADRLVVGLEHRDPQATGVDPPDLGHELEPPRAGLGLEVVAEGEVPQHLEEGLVPVGTTDVVDVHGSEALLDRHRPQERSRRVAEEVRDELVHAGVREQQAGLRWRDQ